LVEVLLSGTSIGYQADIHEEELLNHIATHEAGHALMSILDSDGQNIPEYISTFKSENFAGVVLESCDYNIRVKQHTSYKIIRHTIRVALAGRAAEELIFGVENVDYDGSSTDLLDAYMSCFRLFRNGGVSPVIEQEIATGKLLPNSNLVSYIELEQTDMHKYHTNKIIVKYLQQQNQWVREKLKQHVPLLKTISKELLKKRVLVQSEIKQLLQDSNVK
jgi:ATP-dependent Zn protease